MLAQFFRFLLGVLCALFLVGLGDFIFTQDEIFFRDYNNFGTVCTIVFAAVSGGLFTE